MDPSNPGQTPGAPIQSPAPEAQARVPEALPPGADEPSAPAPSRLPRHLVTIIGGGVLIVACGIAAVVGLALLNPSHAGKVIFTTDVPTGESAGTCQFDHQVTSISAGTPVYAIYFY